MSTGVHIGTKGGVMGSRMDVLASSILRAERHISGLPRALFFSNGQVEIGLGEISGSELM